MAVHLAVFVQRSFGFPCKSEKLVVDPYAKRFIPPEPPSAIAPESTTLANYTLRFTRRLRYCRCRPSCLPLSLLSGHTSQMDSAQLQAALEAVRLNDFLRVYPSESVTTSSQVGDGGFATVWRGTLHKRDAGDLPVVVKVLKGALTEAALRQFLREARVALIVRGRHVCSLLGVTLRDGRPALLLPAYDASLFEIIHYENCLGMPLTLALEVLLKVRPSDLR